MNGKRASQLRRYVRRHVPADSQRAVYKAVVRWWESVPVWVRAQASERMARNELAMSVKMPMPSLGVGAPPPVKRRLRGTGVAMDVKRANRMAALINP